MVLEWLCCWGLSCLGINTQWFGLQVIQQNMHLTPYLYHQVIFFKQSFLFGCSSPIKVNCYTFDAICHLSDHDHDLYWALGHCFVCKWLGYHSETCCYLWWCAIPICHLLDNPDCESILPILVSNSSFSSMSRQWVGWLSWFWMFQCLLGCRLMGVWLVCSLGLFQVGPWGVLWRRGASQSLWVLLSHLSLRVLG